MDKKPRTANEIDVDPTIPRGAKAEREKTRRRDGQAGNPYKGTHLRVQFSWRSIEMQRSPAYRALSLSARKVLDRLEIEFAKHGGNPLENGNLPCTYEHFKEYGIGENQVGPAMKEVVALGFIRTTSPGSAGNADYREAARYLLTYRHAGSDKRIEDGWKRIKTKEEAETIAKSARARVSDSRAREFGIKGAGARWKSKFPATETVAKPPSKEPIHGHRINGHGAQSPATDSVAPLEYHGGGGRQEHGIPAAAPPEGTDCTPQGAPATLADTAVASPVFDLIDGSFRIGDRRIELRRPAAPARNLTARRLAQHLAASHPSNADTSGFGRDWPLSTAPPHAP